MKALLMLLCAFASKLREEDRGLRVLVCGYYWTNAYVYSVDQPRERRPLCNARDIIWPYGLPGGNCYLRHERPV